MPKPDWKRLREQLWFRSGGLCEVSKKPLDFETFDAHHRRNKGMGGTTRFDRDAIWNLLALDPEVHNGGPLSVHGRREWSEERGYLVPKNINNVMMWPVKRWDVQWLFLGANGLYVQAPQWTRPSLGSNE